MQSKFITVTYFLLVGLGFVACDDDKDDDDQGTGGRQSAGASFGGSGAVGQTHRGGSHAGTSGGTSGSTHLGGATQGGSSAGGSVNGGAGPGGSSALGGSSTTGGSSAAGGTSATAGSSAMGGTGQGGSAGSSATGGTGQGGTGQGGTGQGGSAGSSGTFALLSDAQVLHAATTLNAGEVAEAQLAVTRSQNSAVRAFAERMVTDHGTAIQQIATVAAAQQLTPVDNPTSESLRSRTATELTSLAVETTERFDRQYMLAQVAMHQDALILIDTQLVPSAQRNEIDTLLGTLRAAVAEHLSQAQTILAALP
ncbi:MAG: DUF4142 domain-containing protein [Polyangiaceae bacterium]